MRRVFDSDYLETLPSVVLICSLLLMFEEANKRK